MKKLIQVICLILAASTVSAQEAVLNSPVAQPSEAKYVVSTEKGFAVRASGVVIHMEVRSSTATGSVLIREYIQELPEGSATVVGFLNAINTVIAGETGGIVRRMNARIVKYLADSSLLPPATVNP